MSIKFPKKVSNMAEAPQELSPGAAAQSPVAYFKKVLANKKSSSNQLESTLSSRFKPNESIHDEDSSPERVKPQKRKTSSRATPRRTPRRKSEIKPLYDDEDLHSGDMSENCNTDDEPASPPPKAPRSVHLVPFIQGESSPLKSSVAAPVPSPLAMGSFAPRNSSTAPSATPGKVISIGASPRPQNFVSLPGNRSASFVYPSPVSASQSRVVRPIDLPRSSTKPAPLKKASSATVKVIEDGSDDEMGDVMPSVLFPSPSPLALTPPMAASPAIPSSMIGSSPPFRGSTPPSIIRRPSSFANRPAPDSPSSSGFGVSQVADTEPILPSSPIQDDVVEEEPEPVVQGDDVSEVAETPAQSFSEHPADQSIADSDGDIIETSPVGSPRRMRSPTRSTQHPLYGSSGIDVVDIDDVSYEGTPVESGFHTVASPNNHTSPFANRFMMRHSAPDTDGVIPNTANYDDVENSFDQQGTEDDSEIPPPSIEEDIFATLAAEEAALAKAEAADMMDVDGPNSMGKRFQSIKDKNTQIWQRTINGNYAQIPQTSAGLHRRAHDIGKSLFLHGRRSLEAFMLRNIAGGVTVPAVSPTGAPDATMLAQILDIVEDKNIKGLWKTKSRLALEDADGAITFRFAKLLLRNGLGHDVDSKLKAPSVGSWILGMPLSRVTLVEKSDSDEFLFITVMCASWTATTPAQCLKQLDPELNRPVPDLLVSYDSLETNASKKSHQDGADMMELTNQIGATALKGTVVAVHHRPVALSLASRKRDLPSSGEPAAKRTKIVLSGGASQIDVMPSLPAPSFLSAPDLQSFTSASDLTAKYMSDIFARLSTADVPTTTGSFVIRTDDMQLVHVSAPAFPDVLLKIGDEISVPNSTKSMDFLPPPKLHGGALFVSAVADNLTRHSPSVLEISLEEQDHRHGFLNDSQSQQLAPVDSVPNPPAPAAPKRTLRLGGRLRVPISNAYLSSDDRVDRIEDEQRLNEILAAPPTPLNAVEDQISPRVTLVVSPVSMPVNINRWVSKNASELCVVFVTDPSLPHGASVLLSLTETSKVQFAPYLRKGTSVKISGAVVCKQSTRTPTHLVADSLTVLTVLPRSLTMNEDQSVGDPIPAGIGVRINSQVYRADSSAPEIDPTQAAAPSQYTQTQANPQSSFVPPEALPDAYPALVVGKLVVLHRAWFEQHRMQHFSLCTCTNCDSQLVEVPRKHQQLLGQLFCKPCKLRSDHSSSSSVEEKDCIIVYDFPRMGMNIHLIGAPYEHSLSSQIDDRFPLASRIKSVVVDANEKRGILLCLMQGE